MTIRVRLPENALEYVAFAYSPLQEAVLSLHVLVEPKHHPLQHEWVRQARHLPAKLRHSIAAFAFAYRSYYPSFFSPDPMGELPTFDGELQRLRKLPPEAISFEFTRPLYGGTAPRDPSLLQDGQVCQAMLERANELHPASKDLIRLALDDPLGFLDRFVDVLGEYWRVAFAREWERIEPLLAESVVQSGRQIARDGLYAVLEQLWPEVRVDRAAREFRIERRYNHEIVIGEDNPLTLVPSVFVWPHVRVNCDVPWPIELVYPSPHILRDARPRIAPEDLLRVLRSLADDTRLCTLKLIAESPRSTQELAPLLNISEAALSKHLRLLTDAGILQRRREGYYVLYSLVPDRLAPLGASLVAFLG